MDLRHALKDEKVPAKTVLLGREFQWSMMREKKRILKSSSRQEAISCFEANIQLDLLG